MASQARGGMPSAVWGQSTQAMASAAGSQGVRIDLRAAVREIIVERDRAAGVVLEDGTPVRARAVIVNVDPRTLFRDLVPMQAVPRTVKTRMESWESGIGHLPHERRAVAFAGFCGAPRHG